MRISNIVMTLVMLAIFSVFVFVASGYPADARFMPFVVGIPAIGLCLLQLVLDIRGRAAAAGAGGRPGSRETAEQATLSTESGPGRAGSAQALPVAEPEPAFGEQGTVRRELVLWAYFLALVGGVLLFGFWATIPLFLIAFLRLQAQASWRLTLTLSIAATGLLYLALEQAFRLELHRGFVTEYVSDQLAR